MKYYINDGLFGKREYNNNGTNIMKQKTNDNVLVIDHSFYSEDEAEEEP